MMLSSHTTLTFNSSSAHSIDYKIQFIIYKLQTTNLSPETKKNSNKHSKWHPKQATTHKRRRIPASTRARSTVIRLLIPVRPLISLLSLLQIANPEADLLPEDSRTIANKLAREEKVSYDYVKQGTDDGNECED
jgi:hypothetical protein